MPQARGLCGFCGFWERRFCTLIHCPCVRSLFWTHNSSLSHSKRHRAVTMRWRDVHDWRRWMGQPQTPRREATGASCGCGTHAATVCMVTMTRVSVTKIFHTGRFRCLDICTELYVQERVLFSKCKINQIHETLYNISVWYK